MISSTILMTGTSGAAGGKAIRDMALQESKEVVKPELESQEDIHFMSGEKIVCNPPKGTYSITRHAPVVTCQACKATKKYQRAVLEYGIEKGWFYCDDCEHLEQIGKGKPSPNKKHCCVLSGKQVYHYNMHPHFCIPEEGCPKTKEQEESHEQNSH